MPTTRIKPFSAAYFDLLVALPELKQAFALGPRVIVVGRDQAIALADDGVASLSRAALASVLKTW